MRDTIIVLVLLQIIGSLQGQILPKEIKKCHFGDSKCIVNSMNAIIKKYPKGIPAIGLKPIDVVDIKDSKFWNDAMVGAFWLNFDLFNQVNYGFENTTITKSHPQGRLLQYGKGVDCTDEFHGGIPFGLSKLSLCSQAEGHNGVSQ
ncbi:uncharacterized protein LOC6727250 isoform X3 [Drosophila simulans]|uniref:uncharacterized protein LOC6727250 isoform X3 n=1 Tax=Drosophila simulans TaxID=7240 RepID=UPI00192D178A|nr:uncharacterized protein LOC6727250 isoform X3 [Drosophila simulans]